LVKDLGAFLPFVLIVAVFWFLVIRPARKRQHEMTSVQSSIGAGSEVMLGSGIYGRVVSVADDTVRLEVAPGTTVKVARQAVVRVVDRPVDITDAAPGTGTEPTTGPTTGPATGPTGGPTDEPK
jgi:preprotein translocase subunit YajC